MVGRAGLHLEILSSARSIQAFVHVARLGSVKAAADSLSLSSPALSRRIQSLEQAIGGPLFLRQNNAVQLNARGQRLLAEIEPHLDALANAFDRASGEGSEMRLRIAVPSLFLIDKTGTVRWAHSDPDYKVRPSVAQILAAIDAAHLTN